MIVSYFNPSIRFNLKKFVAIYSGQDAGNELCKAAANGDMEFVERLVKAGVDPNETDYSQRTPLHILAADGTAKDVEFLVHEGADVLVKDRCVAMILFIYLLPFLHTNECKISLLMCVFFQIFFVEEWHCFFGQLFRHGYTPLDEARDNDNEATLKVLEAEVARRQSELDADQDDRSDDTNSSCPMDDDQDVDMQLTDGDHWYAFS